MQYQQVDPKMKLQLVAGRIAALEQEHFNLEITIRELLAHSDPEDHQVALRLKEWRSLQERNIKAVEMLRDWQFELAMEEQPETTT